MTCYIEVDVVGSHRAYIEAASIVGVIQSPNMGADDTATPEAPMTLILRGGDSLEKVYGISPSRLILYATGSRFMLRLAKKRIGLLLSIDGRARFEEELVAMKQQVEMDSGGAP